MSRTLLFVISSGAIILAAGSAIAQHHQPKHHQPNQAASAAAVGDAAIGLFRVSVHGAFRNMMRFRDHTPKVSIGTVIDAASTEAVGALSGLRGEITFLDGKPIISYGTPCSNCPATNAEKATLLITARVMAWRQPIPLPAKLSGHDLDRFIIRQANAAGIDMTKPFPIRLTGTLTNVAMHVISAPNPKFGGHGSGQPMALQQDIKAKTIEGLVVGLYAPEPMLGIITHPGEPFHYHWVDKGRTRTAHLDAFGMAEGAQLLLPAK